MPTLEVLTVENQKAGSVEMAPTVFGAHVRPHLFHAEVRRQLAKRRAGTHSTKNRAGVSGGGAKPWKQKGTGRARQGTTRAPQWAGGGVVFGPVPRSYEHDLPKKVRRAALCSALSLRVRDGDALVLEALEIAEYKTRRMAEILQKLGLGEQPTLIVVDGRNDHLERSTRNLPRVQVLPVEGLNVYDVLRHRKLLMTRSAVAAIERRLGSALGEGQA